MSLLGSIKRLFMRMTSEGPESDIRVDEEGWNFYIKGGDHLFCVEYGSTKTVIKVKGDQVFAVQIPLGQTSGHSSRARRWMEKRKQMMNWLLHNDEDPVPKASPFTGSNIISDEDGWSFYNEGKDNQMLYFKSDSTKTVIKVKGDQVFAVQTPRRQTSGHSSRARRRMEKRKQMMNWLLHNDKDPVPKASPFTTSKRPGSSSDPQSSGTVA